MKSGKYGSAEANAFWAVRKVIAERLTPLLDAERAEDLACSVARALLDLSIEDAPGAAPTAPATDDQPLDARDRAQLELADAIEATLQRFLAVDPARRRLVPRSLGVALDRLRKRPHRRIRREKWLRMDSDSRNGALP